MKTDQNITSILPTGWQASHPYRAFNCGGNLSRPRHIMVRSLIGPDGYERCHEGNLVSFAIWAARIIENHGEECTELREMLHAKCFTQ